LLFLNALNGSSKALGFPLTPQVATIPGPWSNALTNGNPAFEHLVALF
jgi:hypothetical protein